MAKKKKKPVRYPWKRWCKIAKAPKVIYRGTHYACASYIIAQQIRNRCSHLRRSVTIHIDPKDKWVEFHVMGTY